MPNLDRILQLAAQNKATGTTQSNSSKQAQIVVNNGAGRVDVPLGTDASKLTKTDVQQIVATGKVNPVQQPLPTAKANAQGVYVPTGTVPLSQRVKQSGVQANTPALPQKQDGPTNSKNLNALLYGTERAAAGLLGYGENLTDFVGSNFYKGIQGISSVGGLLPNKVSDYAGKMAQNFVDESITRDYEQSIKERYNPTQLQETATGIGQGVNNMLASIAIGQGGSNVASALSGTGKLADAAQKAQTAANIGRVANSLNATGAATREAREEGATVEQAMTTGALTGATEALLEGLAGGIPGLGKGKLSKAVRKVISNPIVNESIDIFGEGVEEAASEIIAPFIKRAVYDKDAELATADEIKQSAILGMITSGVLKAGIDLPQAIGNKIQSKNAAKVALPQKNATVNTQTEAVTDVDAETGAEPGFFGPEVDTESDPSAEAKAHMDEMNAPPKEEVLHTKEWYEAIYQAQKAGERLGVKVVLTKDLPNGVNGKYENGTIYISENAKNPLKATFVHELTHHLEATNTYNKLRDYVLNRDFSNVGGLDAYRATIRDAYAKKGKTIDDAGVDAEIVANFIEQKLFNNSKEIAQLANKHRGLVQVIRDWFTDLRVKFRGTAEEKELLRAQRLFEKALRETGAKGYRTSGDGQYSFAGENAETADLAALERAKQMQTAGTDANTILRETGWFVGRDGKWRFEIDDSSMQYYRGGDAAFRRDHPEYAEYQSLMAKMLNGSISADEYARMMELHGTWGGEYKRLSDRVAQGNAKLQNILDHPALYEAYPDLKNAEVVFDVLDGERGRYNEHSNRITISETLKNAPDETLLHEIQHAIQRTENFSRGASPEYWARQKGYDNGPEKAYNKLFRSLSTEQQNQWTRYQELDRILSDLFLVDGREAEYEKYEAQQDDLYEKLYPKKWFRNMLDAERSRQNTEGYYRDLYRNTSGEIEARDAANRMKLTAEERRAQMPDLGDENTVFADGTGYSLSKEEHDSIKEQLKNHQHELNQMDPVASVSDNGWRGMSTGDFKKKIVNDLKKTNYKVDRQGFGYIEFDEKLLNTSLDYIRTDAEAAAYQAIPRVLKRGIEVGGHGNHKNRGYETITFAAPVELNGKRGNMAVVVKETKGHRYKVHRVLTPDGKPFELPEKANAEFTSAGGITEAAKASGVVTPAINSASAYTVPQTTSPVKPNDQLSIDLGEDDPFRASTGRTADEINADIKSNVDQYSAMRENKQPGVREATYPHETAHGKTMHTAQTIGGSNLVDDRMELDVKEAILAGKFAYEVSGDKAALRDVNKRIEDGSYDKLAEQAKGYFADGYRLKKEQVVFVERMIQEAAKKGDVDTAMALITDLAAYGTEQGQNIQALSMIRRMTPEGKLMVLKRQVDKANKMTQVDRESKGEIKKTEQEIKAVKKDAFAGLEDIGVDESMDIETAQQIVDEAIADETAKAGQSGLPTAKKQQLQQKKQKLSEAEKKIRELEKAAKNLKNPVTIPTETVEAMLKAKSPSEQNDLYNKALDEIASQIVSSLPDKINAWRYLAMLGNPRTHVRNITGNATMLATNAAKNIVKRGFELIPGTKKTTVLKASKDAKAFAKEDFELNRDLITGGGKMNASDELRDRMKIFENKGLEALRKFNTNAMEAEDTFFMRHAYESALARYITANKKSKAFLESGSAAAESFLQKARDYAIKEAREVTFHDDSAVADWLSGITRSAKDDKLTVKAAKAMVEGVLPFKKTPINVAKRGIEYSPVSIATAINKFAKGDAEGAVNDLAKGTTGTIMMAVGLALAHFGMLRTKNEEKDEVLDTQENEQNYSLRIPNADGTVTSVSLDALMPAAMPLLVGVEVNKLLKEENMSVMSVLESLTGIADPIVENSMLDGLNDMLTYVGYSDSAIGSIAADMGESYVEQFRPSILRQVQQSIDPTVRTTYTPKDSPIGKGVEAHLRSLANVTPVLPWAAEKLDDVTGSDRFSLQPKIDVWGNEVKRADSFGARLVQNMVLPFNVKKVTSDPVNEELRRLYHVDSTYSVLPKAADKSFEYQNENYYATPAEYTELAKAKGQTMHDYLETTIKDAEYKALPDAKKADVVSNLMKYANYKAKQDFFDGRGINYVTDTFNGVEKAVERGLTAEDYYIMKAQMDGGQTAEEKIPYYMSMLTNEQKKFVARLPKDAASASWLERIALSNQGENAKTTSAYDDILIGEKKEKVDYSDKASVYLSLIDGNANSKVGDKYYEYAKPAGVSVEDYMVAYYAQKDVTYPAKTKGAKAAAEAAAIDKALPNLSKKQREALYQAFK